MHFNEQADLTLWLPAAGAAQRCVDAAVASFKAGDQSPAVEPAQAPPGRPPVRADLYSRISEELGYVSRLIEALGDELADDPMITSRYANKLQTLDITGQILGHFGRIIDADDPKAAIDAIGMADLRRRLQRASRSDRGTVAKRPSRGR